jgi:hypothetical protein
LGYTDLESEMTLDIPASVVLSDGSSAQVKRVSATLINAELAEVVYTVEKVNGSWAELRGDEVRAAE